MDVKTRIGSDLYGLDTLRAIAALSITLTHINSNAPKLDLPKIQLFSTTIGVTVFFVLSGFLITYILLNLSVLNNQSILNFYMRRILRILPLYYCYLILALIGALLIRPDLVEIDNVKYYILLFPNIAWIQNKGLPFLNHYWSLGVEEQFYLIWPVFVLFCNKRLLWLTVILFMLILGINVFVFTLPLSETNNSILYACQYHTLLIGCIGSILMIKHPIIILNIASNKLLNLAAWGVLISYQIGISFFSHFNELIVGVSALLVIYRLVLFQSKNIFFNNDLLKYLGKISFGIYVFHPLLIGLAVNLVRMFNLSITSAIFFYLFVLLLTIIVAMISYKFFESKFLSLKNKFY